MNDWIRQLAGLGLMRLVMDMALPEGEGRQYADLGMGLMMMLCMLDGLKGLLQGWM